MAPKKTFIIHDVQKGDTVFSLAKKYKMTVDEFMVVNGLRDTNIRVGQTLKAKAGSTQ
jgi:LysM repeat protein